MVHLSQPGQFHLLRTVVPECRFVLSRRPVHWGARSTLVCSLDLTPGYCYCWAAPDVPCRAPPCVPAAFPFHYAAARLLLERTDCRGERNKERKAQQICGVCSLRSACTYISSLSVPETIASSFSLVRFIFSSVFFFSALFLFFLFLFSFSPGIAVCRGGWSDWRWCFLRILASYCCCCCYESTGDVKWRSCWNFSSTDGVKGIKYLGGDISVDKEKGGIWNGELVLSHVCVVVAVRSGTGDYEYCCKVLFLYVRGLWFLARCGFLPSCCLFPWERR